MLDMNRTVGWMMITIIIIFWWVIGYSFRRSKVSVRNLRGDALHPNGVQRNPCRGFFKFFNYLFIFLVNVWVLKQVLLSSLVKMSENSGIKQSCGSTVNDVYINTIKTSFYFNFNSYLTFRQLGYSKNGIKEKLSINRFLCLLVNL